jgi:hypothetical protein
MKKILFLLIILLSVTGISLAEDVSVTATPVSDDGTTIIYSIDITSTNIDLMSFRIIKDDTVLSITSITSGSQIPESAIDSNLESGTVMIDISGFAGQEVSGSIALVELSIIDNSGNKDIGISNIEIIPGENSGTTIDNIEEDELEEPETQEQTDSNSGKKFTKTTFIPGEIEEEAQYVSTPQTQTPSNNNNNDEEPEDDNSILMYSLIAVGAIILIVGGFVALNKFKKPKDELPIHETTPLQQPDQPQQPQPAPQQPQPAPDQPPTDQTQPDQPTQ